MPFLTLKPEFKELIAPYAGIIRFVVALTAAHLVWKYAIGEPALTVLSQHFANLVYTILHACGNSVELFGTHLRYANGHGTEIVGGCTAVKQAFIWLVIMLCARGAWVHKLWYIPLGWVACYIFNVVRIALIVVIIEDHPEAFELWHGYILKYLFYGMLFLLWMLWDNGGAQCTMHDAQ